MRTRLKTFLKSIKGKILLYIGSTVVLMAIGVIGFFTERQYKNLRKAHESLMVEDVANAALSVEKENFHLISIARTMAESQEGGLFGQRQESIRYAQHVLVDNPRLAAAFFAYEPNADQNDEAFLRQATGAQAPALDATGRFLPRWARDKNDPTIVKLASHFSNRHYRWLRDQLGTGEEEKPCIITEPHSHEDWEKTVIEAQCPLVIDGKFVGVAGVGRTVTTFYELLRRLETPYETATFFLLSDQKKIVSTTFDVGLEMQDVEDTAYGKVLGPFLDTNLQEPSLRLMQDPIEKETYYYAGASIPTGAWTIVMRVPRDEILAPLWHTLIRVTVMSAVGIFLILASVLWIANSITKPISAAIAVAEKVAAGDLTARVGLTSDGETGQLLAAISAMTQRLNTLVGQVQLSSISLGSTTAEIASTAKRQATTAKEASTFANTIMAATQEISTTSQEFAQLAKDLTEVATENAARADTGRNGLASMEHTMRQLLETNGEIAAKLAVLSEKANNINSVITTITKVADQTNLLSLNAAIEAEKAGEYGRGFSVVAREIRRLADQTAVATLDIERMVTEMQAAVSAGVTGLSTLTEEVRQSYTEVDKINSQLGQMIERMQALAPRLATFNQGVQSQSKSAQRISESMAQLGTVAQKIAEALQETDQATGLLNEETQALRGEIARFKVNILE